MLRRFAACRPAHMHPTIFADPDHGDAEAEASPDASPRRSMQTDVRIALLVLCTIGILAVLTGMEAFNITAKTLEYQGALEAATKRQARIGRVLSMLQEAETVRRDSVETGHDDYLRRLGEIRHEMPQALKELAEAPGGNGMQAVRAARLQRLVSARMRQFSGGAQSASTLAASVPREAGSGRERADESLSTKLQINALANEMIDFQEREIRAATQNLKQRIRSARPIIISLLAGIVVLVTVVIGLSLAYLTRRDRMEMKLVEATRMASAASEAKTEFLAAMSHEVRTPLTSILGYTELLLEEQLNSDQRDYITRLQSAGVSLSALVDDILDFSKIEAGEIEIVDAPFALDDLIANCLSITSVIAEKKGLELRTDIDPDLPERLVGDESRLRQVLLNLLNNAVKFTKEGWVALRVGQVANAEVGARIRFEVVDTGIGIPRERQHRLFRHFSQASPSVQHEYGGTGLGLAIARRLVELMGGEIGIESEECQGSLFWFTVRLPEGEAVQRAPPRESEGAAASGGRILLAEDAVQNRDLVRKILEKHGYEVDVAKDGEEAVAAFGSASYDLVLMDIQMPVMDGTTATRKIRSMEGAAGTVPIIAMTANVVQEQLASFRQIGINDHIAKPFRQCHLTAKVRVWLDAERERPGAAGASFEAPAACDHDAFNEIRELMGDEWIRASLDRLRVHLDEIFGGPAGDMANRDRLKRQAHQIVSDAGNLGFAELSASCSALEQACAADEEVEDALERVRRAGDRATSIADLWLREARLPGHRQPA